MFAEKLEKLASVYEDLDLIWSESDLERSEFLEKTGVASNVCVYENLNMAAGVIKRENYHRLLESGITPLGLNQLARVNPVEHVMAAGAAVTGNWGLDHLRVRDAWARTRGEDISVAVLDSGIDGSHEAFQGRVAEVSYVVDSLGNAQPRTGLSSDSGHHGTHVASIIVGSEIRSPTGDPLLIGVAPDATVHNIQVLDGDAGTVRQIIGGINAAAALNVDVINLSVEVGGRNAAFSVALKTLVDMGIIVVVAAGNTGPGHHASPGNYTSEFVLSAGAHAEDGSVWQFGNGAIVDWDEPLLSGRASVPAVTAPGAKIMAAAAGGGLKMLSGTSMAAPHVAGVCALLKSANLGSDHASVMGLITEHAVDAGMLGWDDRYGTGMLSMIGLLID